VLIYRRVCFVGLHAVVSLTSTANGVLVMPLNATLSSSHPASLAA
jgi:hypothetical protein